MRANANRYFVIPPTHTDAIAFDPTDPSDRPTFDCAYFGAALAEVERLGVARGLTFYLTADVDRLPSYGPDVVAVVLADEWARVPAYVHRVRATFKCYGTDLALGARPPRSSGILTLASAAQYLRLNLRRLPTLARHAVLTARLGPPHGPLVPVPLGYLRQIDVPLVPIAERRYDAYFKGSTQQHTYAPSSPKYWLRSAKTISRQRMIDALASIRERHPGLRVEIGTLPAFFTGSDTEAYEYSTTMMHTKVCLVPRGASLETFRYFEALRAGCVVIAEPLPDRWFYRDSPAYTIDDWSRLEALLVPILRDPALMARKHREALAWWQDRAGEAALGRRLAAELDASASAFAGGVART